MRRRYGGQVVEEHAKDVIAAEYRHTTARGVAGRRRPTRSCTATSSSAARSGRTSGSSRSHRGRSSGRPASWARSTAPRSPRSWPARAMRSSGAPARTAATSRSPGCHEALIEEFSGRSREVARAAERFPCPLRPCAGARGAAQPRAREPPRQGADHPRATCNVCGARRPPPRVRSRRGGAADRRARAAEGRAAGRGPHRGAADRAARRVPGARSARRRAGADRRGDATRSGARGRAGRWSATGESSRWKAGG